MGDFIAQTALSGSAAQTAGWLVVGRAALWLWLWLHLERTRTAVARERLARSDARRSGS